MKRNPLRIGLFLAFAAVVVAACITPFAPEDKPVRPGSDDYALELSLNCMRTATKVTIPGEARYNENKISHIDWFVFTSDADNAVAVLHGRENLDKDDVTERFLAKTVAMDDYVSTYGNAGNASGYVLVVANLPDTHDELSVKTIAELRSVPVTAVFDNYHLTDPTDYTSAVFDPQDSFTMLSGLLRFTLTVEEPVADVVALMKRTASKVTLKINLARAIDEVNAIMEGRDTVRVEYLQTWYPDTSNIQIYMSYANSKSTLDGTPLSYNQQNFFTYNRYSYHYNIEPSAERDHVDYDVHEAVLYHKVEGTPFYSFPITWNISDANAPFIKIIIPWDAYKETVTMDRTHNYLWHDGEELKYRPGDTLKVVTRNHLPANFETSQDFYYKISIPDEDELMRSNYWYRISLDVAILGSRDDDLSTELSGHYYVMDWADPHQSSGGVLTQGRYLGVPVKEFTMNGVEDLLIPVNSSHALSARIIKREAHIDGVWTETPKKISATDLRPRNLTTRGSVTANGRVSVSFTDALSPQLNTNLDCYPLRFTIEIYHTDDPSLMETVTIVQYPAIYIDIKPGGGAMVDGYFGNLNGNYLCRRFYNNRDRRYDDSQYNSGSATGNYANYHTGTLQTGASGTSQNQTSQTNGIYNGMVWVPYGRIARFVNTQQNLTVVSISSFTEDSYQYTISGNQRTYRIADPRQPSGYSTDDYNTTYPLNDRRRPLVPYYTNGENHEWGEDAAKIMIGHRTTPDYIAPKLIIASRWSRMVNSSNTAENGYDAMERRCATYQEAGYPAGRWRLPTEAEVNFIANMQRLDFIEDLFTGYGWVSNGTAVQIGTNSVTLIQTGNTARCVYDAWYWGEDPVVDPSVYTVKVD